MDILSERAGQANIRLVVLMFVVLIGVVVTLVYFPPVPTRTEEERTRGAITFTDGAGNPLDGTISISVAGEPKKPQENVNFISWSNVPNAIISFNALDTKNLSVNLRISGDSPGANVSLESFGITLPENVKISAPGDPVKYVEIRASGVYFIEAEIHIQYTDEELNGLDENNLVIYHYDSAAQTWNALTTDIDAKNNTVSTTVNSLSTFAVSTSLPQEIEVHDTKKMPVISDIKTYDEAKTLITGAKTSTLSAADVQDRGELEVDALASKNVAVRLKVNRAGKGKIILDDYGNKNPVSVPLPGRAVKYVEIGASDLSFSFANITIRYSDSELNGGNEKDLTIYHWKGAEWVGLPTAIDMTNKTLSTTTTSLSPFGVATSAIYYLENNATAQSVGTDGNTDYSESGKTITVIPYKNLMINGTVGPQVNISYNTTVTSEIEAFRFYLPFDYSVDTQISPNTKANISWRAVSVSDSINVSLIDYNPANGGKNLIGSTNFITTGGATYTFTVYPVTIPNPQYTVQAGNRLMTQINTTTPTTGTVSLYFNDGSSNITIIETALGGSPAPGIISWGNNKTNDNSGSISINTNESVRFNATADQDITAWNWYRDDLNQNNNYDSFSTSWYTSGMKTVKVNATNANGTSSTVIWSVAVNLQIGPDCISCHEYGVQGGAPDNKKINVSAIKQGSHRNLNRNAINTAAIDPINKACWACHGDGTQPAGHPNYPNENIYKTPWTCVNCHNRSDDLRYPDIKPTFNSTNKTLESEITGKTVAQHIPFGRSINSTTKNSTADCYACHDQSKVSFVDAVAPDNSLSSNVSHYGSRSELVSPSFNCTLCHKSKADSSKWFANITRHPARSQNYTFCTNCHNSSNATTLHDASLIYPIVIHGFSTTEPYPNNAGFDFEGDDWNALDPGVPYYNESCYACHYDSTGLGRPTRLCEECHLPDNSSMFKGAYSYSTGNVFRLRPDINSTLPRVYAHTNYSEVTEVLVRAQPQKNDPLYPSSCYGYNTSTGEGTCHGTSYYNSPDGFYAFWANQTYRSSHDPAHYTRTIDRMPETSNCLYCHNQSNAAIRNVWANPPQVNDTSMFGNKYDAAKNESCYACHTLDNSTPPDFHSSTITEGGGPGCLDCHNASSPQNYTDRSGNALHYIDGGNFSLSVHAGMNSANASGYGINASCWACHSSSGNVVPSNTHPDRKTTPYTCTDCHLESGSRAGVYNATIVSEHFINGSKIRTANATSNISSCIGCHENVSEMIQANIDTDTGSFYGDGVGQNGGNMSFYHYGKPRNELRLDNTTNCSYCHQNTSTAFATAMADPVNSSNITNHSPRYNSSTPACSAAQCHNSSNATLHASQLKKPNITLPDSSYCLDCHGKNGTGGINYTWAATMYKEKHYNAVDCTDCHLNSGKDIHPVKYLQLDSSYSLSNSIAVDCVACHVTGMAKFPTSAKVPNPLHHSDNLSNGTIWNASGYWSPDNPVSACIYCHNDTEHNATALGRPQMWKGDNTINSNISSTSNWCASCHYQGYISGGKTYTFTVSAFIAANLSVPPEITNGTYAPRNLSGYYNHSLTPDYSDITCASCHGKFTQTDVNIDEFMHNITTGSCTDCHFSFAYMSGVNKPEKFVNRSMFEASPHGSLRCEDCHTKGHKNIGARKACEDCHAYQENPRIERERHNITRTPSTYIYNGTDVVNITDCTTCHDATLYSNSTATYGYNKGSDCDYCHTYPDKTYS